MRKMFQAFAAVEFTSCFLEYGFASLKYCARCFDTVMWSYL